MPDVVLQWKCSRYWSLLWVWKWLTKVYCQISPAACRQSSQPLPLFSKGITYNTYHETDRLCTQNFLKTYFIKMRAVLSFFVFNTSIHMVTWAPSQYPKRCLIVRSREVSKPRDLCLELSDHSEIWQALQQHCCRCACQISKRYNNLKYQSRGFEISRDLTIRRLFGYRDGALDPGQNALENVPARWWPLYSGLLRWPGPVHSEPTPEVLWHRGRSH